MIDKLYSLATSLFGRSSTPSESNRPDPFANAVVSRDATRSETLYTVALPTPISISTFQNGSEREKVFSSTGAGLYGWFCGNSLYFSEGDVLSSPALQKKLHDVVLQSPYRQQWIDDLRQQVTRVEKMYGEKPHLIMPNTLLCKKLLEEVVAGPKQPQQPSGTLATLAS